MVEIHKVHIRAVLNSKDLLYQPYQRVLQNPWISLIGPTLSTISQGDF